MYYLLVNKNEQVIGQSLVRKECIILIYMVCKFKSNSHMIKCQVEEKVIHIFTILYVAGITFVFT